MTGRAVGKLLDLPVGVILQAVERTTDQNETRTDSIEDNRIVVAGEAEITGRLAQITGFEMAFNIAAFQAPANADRG